jgi:hypothetical protein
MVIKIEQLVPLVLLYMYILFFPCIFFYQIINYWSTLEIPTKPREPLGLENLVLP